MKPIPTNRLTIPCRNCNRLFGSARAAGVHRGKSHRVTPDERNRILEHRRADGWTIEMLIVGYGRSFSTIKAILNETRPPKLMTAHARVSTVNPTPEEVRVQTVLARAEPKVWPPSPLQTPAVAATEAPIVWGAPNLLERWAQALSQLRGRGRDHVDPHAQALREIQTAIADLRATVEALTALLDRDPFRIIPIQTEDF
jgi:hypothetical protein